MVISPYDIARRNAMKRYVRQQHKAAEEFAQRMRHALPNRKMAFKLYGSVARGESKWDSDVDVFLRADQMDKALLQIKSQLAFDVSLDYDVVLSVVTYSDEVQYTPFIEHVKSEGIAI
jgi:predicted nucleotidyltransferase